MCATRRNTSQDVKTFQIVCYSRENWGRTAVLVENGGGFSDRKNCGATPLFPSTGLPGGHSEREPPDPIPNSEVKTFSADGSVGSPHVRVGHCQALDSKGHVHPNVAFLFGARGMAYKQKAARSGAAFFLMQPRQCIAIGFCYGAGQGLLVTSAAFAQHAKRPDRAVRQDITSLFRCGFQPAVEHFRTGFTLDV